MEILSETVHSGSHTFAIVFLSIVSIFFIGISILILVYSIIERDFGWNEFFGFICCLGFGLLCAFATVNGINQGADVTYKAIVNDFNEVYNNGYKIVDQDGEIYILEKTR